MADTQAVSPQVYPLIRSFGRIAVANYRAAAAAK
jgi:hypothetical protein